jgi:two-component system, NarL family, response regulator DevR
MSIEYRPALRVYLLDDHDIVRGGLRDLMAVKRDITVVGDSGSAREAVQAITRLRPHVMLLDVHLPDGSGIEVCRAVRAQDPSIAGVLLTAAADDEALLAAMLAGAVGYVVKLSRSADILGAVRAAGAGRRLLPDADRLSTASQAATDRAKSLDPLIPPRQLRVLQAMLDGLATPEIAERVGCATADVERDVGKLIALLT